MDEFVVAYFAHSSTPSVFYTIEPASSALTSLIEVDQGTLNPSQGTVTGMTPSYLLYTVGGSVMQASLIANGQAPSSSVAFASGSSYICSLVGTELDYDNPLNSEFFATTAGPDGQCGTSDDGSAVLGFVSPGNLVINQQFPAGSPLIPYSELRDPATLEPAGWFSNEGVYLSSTGSEYVLYPVGATIRVLVRTASQELVLVNNAVVVTTYGGSPSSLSAQNVTGLGACGTPMGLGSDAENFYVACNSLSNTYDVYAVSRNTYSASLWASGTGSANASNVGTYSLYFEVISGLTCEPSGTCYSDNSEVAINKQTLAATVIEPLSADFVGYVETNDAGNDILAMQSTGADSSAVPSLTFLSPTLQVASTITNASFQFAYYPLSQLNLIFGFASPAPLVLSNTPQVGNVSGGTLNTLDLTTASLTPVGLLPTASQLNADVVSLTTYLPVSQSPALALVVGKNSSSAITTQQLYSFTPGVASSLQLLSPAQ